MIEHLQNAIRMDKVSHAYIFNGEDGVGKNLMANCFSMALECEEGGVCACGHCKSCLQAISGNHPDIIRVNHEKSVILLKIVIASFSSFISSVANSSKFLSINRIIP